MDLKNHSQLRRTLADSAALRLGLVFAAALALAALGATGLAAIGDHRRLADSANPYFIPAQALAFNLFLPAAGVAMGLSLLAPGLLIAYAQARGRDGFGLWALKGFAFSFPILGLAPMIAAAAGAAPLVGAPAFAMLGVLTIAALAAALAAERGAPRSTMLADRGPDIALALGAPFAAIALMSAKFYWEDLNPDGAHLFETARMMVVTGGIFWPAGSPEILANTPTLNNLLHYIPSAWMMRLAGETELALRLVFPLGIGVMAAAILAAIRLDRAPARPWRLAAGLGASLCLYAFVLAFNTSYYPYFADISIPAAREPLIVAAFIGFALSTLRERVGWTVAFALLTYASGPNGLILMGLWTLAMTVAAGRPWRVRRAAIALGAALLAAIAAAAAGAVLAALDLAAIGNEFGPRGLAERLRFVSFESWPRIGYVLIGCGIVPAAALFAWRAQDEIARAFTLTTLAYFLFFYVQAYRILPHHFAPAMALPLIVFWRTPPLPGTWLARAMPAALMLALVVAAAGAWPSTTRPHTLGRAFAGRIAVESNAAVDADAAAMFHILFDHAFPRRNTEEGWRERYYGSSFGWYVYADHGADPAAAADYRMRRPGSPIAPGETVIAACAGWTLTARDAAVYADDLAAQRVVTSISPSFYVLREEVFGRGAASHPRRVYDLAEPVRRILVRAVRPTPAGGTPTGSVSGPHANDPCA